MKIIVLPSDILVSPYSHSILFLSQVRKAARIISKLRPQICNIIQELLSVISSDHLQKSNRKPFLKFWMPDSCVFSVACRGQLMCGFADILTMNR